DDVVVAVAVHITRGHVDAAAEARVEGEVDEEVEQRGAVLAAEYLDLGNHPRPGANNDVRYAIVVDVAECHAYAAGEPRIEGEEAIDGRTVGVEDHDMRAATCAGACGNERDAAAVDGGAGDSWDGRR